MAHYKIFGQDPYWMNFYGLMILTLIEVAAVGLDLTEFAESYGTTAVSYTHLTLPTKRIV